MNEYAVIGIDRSASIETLRITASVRWLQLSLAQRRIQQI